MGLFKGKGNGPVRLAGTPGNEAVRNAPVVVAEQQVRLAREKGDKPDEVGALVWLSSSLLQTGQAAEALAAAQQASAIAEGLGDPSSQAKALEALGAALAKHQRNDEAIAASGAAVAIHRRLGDHKRESETLSDLCVQLLAVGRYAEAAEAAQATLPLVTHDRGQQCTALFNLGTALYGAGRHAEAVPVLQRSAQEWNALPALYPDGNRDVFVTTEAKTLARLGSCLIKLGRVDEGIDAHRRAAVLFDECGVYDEKARSMLDIGVALLGRRSYDDAIPALQEAASEFAGLDDTRYELSALLNLASAFTCVNRHQEAADVGARAVRSARPQGDRSLEAKAWFNLGKSRMMIPGQMQQGVVDMEQALGIYQELGDRRNETLAIYLLGAMLTDMDRAEEGVRHSQRAAELFREQGETQFEAGALRNLQIGLGKLNRR